MIELRSFPETFTIEQLPVILKQLPKLTQPQYLVTSIDHSTRTQFIDIIHCKEQNNGEEAKKVEALQQYYLEHIKSPQLQLEMNDFFAEIEWIIEDIPFNSQAYNLDQLLCIGYQLSALAVVDALENEACRMVDARDIIVSDEQYGAAQVMEEPTASKIKQILHSHSDSPLLTVLAGGIGCSSDNQVTRLAGGILKTTQLIEDSFLDQEVRSQPIKSEIT